MSSRGNPPSIWGEMSANSPSIYSYRVGSGTLGAGTRGGGCPDVLGPALEALEELVIIISEVVDEFFPTAVTRARVIGDMNATAEMSPILFVRLFWIKTHPGQKFTNSSYEQYELIDIYLQFPPLDWKSDQYITVTL